MILFSNGSDGELFICDEFGNYVSVGVVLGSIVIDIESKPATSSDSRVVVTSGTLPTMDIMLCNKQTHEPKKMWGGESWRKRKQRG